MKLFNWACFHSFTSLPPFKNHIIITNGDSFIFLYKSLKRNYQKFKYGAIQISFHLCFK